MAPTPEKQLPSGNSVAKLPPIPKGSKIQRRPIASRPVSTRSEKRIYVTPKTPFRSVTTRVRKQLDKYLRQASSSNKTFTNKLATDKHIGLSDRIEAIQRQSQAQAGKSSGSGIGLEDATEVVVSGTGRAVQKVVEVALFFQKQPDVMVQLRTESVGAVDDVVEENEEEEDPFAGGEQRVRMMSALNVFIRL
ncbi:Rpp20 subunit of nuclear RNase MRP and P-domain-containing protein, partial [Xylariaceae sp. FL0016]